MVAAAVVAVVVAAVVVVVAVAADSHLRDALPLGPLHVQAQLLVRAVDQTEERRVRVGVEGQPAGQELNSPVLAVVALLVCRSPSL